YGHETGDQVLRRVSAKLASVTGGGRAYRVGGEEFAIVFPGKSVKEVLPHLELLRSVIEVSHFHVRGGHERRSSGAPLPSSRQPDDKSERGQSPAGRSNEAARQNITDQNLALRERRNVDRRAETRRPRPAKRRSQPTPISCADQGDAPLSVTVSIGVAHPDVKARAPEQVTQAADKALYRAKQAGRNR